MESNTQKLIHSFGALADLGQEVADTGDFMEMVRTSLHLLLGTLAIRRGAIIECPTHHLPEDLSTNLLAVWGVGEEYQPKFDVEDADREVFLNAPDGAIVLVQSPTSKVQSQNRTGSGSDRVEDSASTTSDTSSVFFHRYATELRQQGFTRRQSQR
jgi:hypothetical protein